jgi:putative ABC transport system permease protein
MIKNYLKIAFKVLLRRKFFTFISLFGISFTLVVLMVVAALFDHVFAPFPPETKLDRTLNIYWAATSKNGEVHQLTGPGYALLDRYARSLPNVEKFAIHSYPSSAISYKEGAKISSYMKNTDGDFWDIFNFNFLEGGPYSLDDVKRGHFVAVINEATRNKFFGIDPAVGKTIIVDDQRFRVVGVVENVPIFRVTPFADIWVPITTSKTDIYRKEMLGLQMGSLLARSKKDLPAIKEEYRSRLARVKLEIRGNENDTVTGSAETLFDTFSRFLAGSIQKSVLNPPTGRLWAVMLTMMILFMLLPTINLVNINVSRIRERASEIGVRKAFGATSRTLVGQFVTENVVLTLLGGLVGFVLSPLVLRVVTESGLIKYAHFQMNYRIFFTGLLIALFFGLFSGVYPAWKMSRLHPVEALRGRSL